MANRAISEAALKEILTAFVWAEKLPSAEALNGLAAAAAVSVQQLKDDYKEIYQDTEMGDDDPWAGKRSR